MTTDEIKHFCYRYRNDWFNSDRFIREFHRWNRWDFDEFKLKAMMLGVWRDSMEIFDPTNLVDT